MTDHSDLIAELRALSAYPGDAYDRAADALTSQTTLIAEIESRSDSYVEENGILAGLLSEAREEIERLKGLVSGTRECLQEPVGWTFEFLGYDGEWGRAFAFFDQGEPANGSGAIVRNVTPVQRGA